MPNLSMSDTMNTVTPGNTSIGAEVRLPSNNVSEDLVFFTKTLGFRLLQIFPADDPTSIVIEKHGLVLRLEKGATESPGTVRLTCENPEKMCNGKTTLTAPCGSTIELVKAHPGIEIPETQHAFAVRRLTDNAPWVIGRAGMHYRDLIPGRLGGAIIASHIRIPDGGPVPDMVHYHTVGFQLIYCYRGWVDVVYEDQGDKLRLTAGDCLIQPPEIRHRVLEASDNVEVIEIGVPAEHTTTVDHDMKLPNDTYRPERKFSGQTFVNHKVSDARWAPWRMAGFEHRDTGILAGTGGVANVQVARVLAGFETSVRTSHNSDILFSFVMEGTMNLVAEGEGHSLEPGDAFVIPPDQVTAYENLSADLELLEVSLPGSFKTTRHPQDNHSHK